MSLDIPLTEVPPAPLPPPELPPEADTAAEELPDASSCELQLWLDWRRHGNTAAREALIEQYLPYARIIALKLYRRRHGEEFELADYVQFATVGMLEAMEHFEPGGPAGFRTYSSRRIHGAILDGLHTMSERQQQIDERRRLREERAASLREGTAKDDPLACLAEIAIGLALGYMLEDSAMFLQGEPSLIEQGYQRLEMRQLQRQLLVLIDQLPQRERYVVKAHYFNHQPFCSIADTLGVTKARVSQLHRSAMDRLRQLSAGLRPGELAW